MRSTVNSKARITIPKRIRDQLGLIPGTKLSLKVRDGVIVARPIRRSIQEIFSLLKRHDRRPISVEEMDEAIAAEVCVQQVALPAGHHKVTPLATRNSAFLDDLSSKPSIKATPWVKDDPYDDGSSQTSAPTSAKDDHSLPGSRNE